MSILTIAVLRRDPALLNASGLIAGPVGTPGQNGRNGTNGANGTNGSPGSAGRGVLSLFVDGNSHLIVRYTDNTSTDIGPITVPPATGVDGGTF